MIHMVVYVLKCDKCGRLASFTYGAPTGEAAKKTDARFTAHLRGWRRSRRGEERLDVCPACAPARKPRRTPAHEG